MCFSKELNSVSSIIRVKISLQARIFLKTQISGSKCLLFFHIDLILDVLNEILDLPGKGVFQNMKKYIP